LTGVQWCSALNPILKALIAAIFTWLRRILPVPAISIHNIPEGLAVGLALG
jgi:zinc transporter ZupT